MKLYRYPEKQSRPTTTFVNETIGSGNLQFRPTGEMTIRIPSCDCPINKHSSSSYSFVAEFSIKDQREILRQIADNL
ncbi:MAG: hypothetical protein AAGF31_09665 [Planctomycetota bacterium]